MPRQQKKKLVFDSDMGDYYSEVTVYIKGGEKIRQGKTYYSEALIRAEFERALQLLIKK